jgi:putative acetyltransferase
MKEVYMAKLVEATRAEQVAVVRGLFAEYARFVDEPACFVEVRFLDSKTAEMKRLYVRSTHRGKGLGRALAEAAIAVAREAGCARIVLDTLPKMREAQALYELLGFRRTGPYLREPTPGALCFELKL